MKPRANSKQQTPKSAILEKIAKVIPKLSNDPTVRFVEYVMSDTLRKWNFIAAYDIYVSQASFIYNNVAHNGVKSKVILKSLVEWHIRSHYMQVIHSMYTKCDIALAAEMMASRADSVATSRKKD